MDLSKALHHQRDTELSIIDVEQRREKIERQTLKHLNLKIDEINNS